MFVVLYGCTTEEKISMGGMIGANAQMRQKIISDNFSLKKSLVYYL